MGPERATGGAVVGPALPCLRPFPPQRKPLCRPVRLGVVRPPGASAGLFCPSAAVFAPAGLKAASRRCPRLSSTCLPVSGLSSGAEVRPWSHVLFLLGSRFCSALGLGWPCPAGSGYVGDLVVTFLLFPAHCRGSAVFRPEQDRLPASLCRGVAGSRVGGVRRPHQPPGASSSASGVCCSSETLAFHFPSLFVLPLTVTRAVSL